MVGTSNSNDKTPDAALNLAEIVRLRGRAFSDLRRRADSITTIATAVEELDSALQSNTAGRSIDLQQNLVSAARRLSDLIEPAGRAS